MSNLEFESLNEFKRNLTSKQALKIGSTRLSEEWCEKNLNEYDEWSLSEDGTRINIGRTYFFITHDKLDLHSMPDSLKFGKINGYLSVGMNMNLPPLESWFPDQILGDLNFHDNNIRPTVKQLRRISNISGTITLTSGDPEVARQASKRYRERGSVKDRKTHNLKNIPGVTPKRGFGFSGGYKLYKALKFIHDKGKEGARRKDITNIIYNTGRSEFVEAPVGWGSGWFNYYPRKRSGINPSDSEAKGPLYRYTQKNSDNKYILNNLGKERLKYYEELYGDK